MSCVNCGSVNVCRERSITGLTKCIDCRLSLPHAMWDSFKKKPSVEKELAAAKELLKLVFGYDCVTCQLYDLAHFNCSFFEELPEEDRHENCPYIPFEETK